MRKFSSYDEYIHSEEWRKRRLLILKRDNYQCQRCGSAKQLRVHHIHYPENYGEEPDEDLITLCDTCHSLVHKIDIQVKQKKEDTRQKNKTRAEYEQIWADKEKRRDFIYGGSENMCSLNLLKESAEKFAKDHNLDYLAVTRLQAPLGQMHCLAVKMMHKRGLSEDEIFNRTPLPLNTIKKYIQTQRKYSFKNDAIPYEEAIRTVTGYIDEVMG